MFWRRKPPPPQLAVVDRDEWLGWMKLGGSSQNTIASYRRTTDLFLKRWPELSFAEFTDEHIQGFVEEANAASRQSRRGAFANWFGWGFRSKRLATNPMHHVPTYKQTPQPEIDTFSEVEQKAMCALPDPDGTLMAVLLGTGMRKTEALNVTVRRCDLEHAEIHVVEGAKGGKSRVIPLNHELVARLAGYFLTEGLNEDDYLWYCHPGGQAIRRHDRVLTGASFHQWWKRCIERAGVRYRKPHTTRHTYAEEWRRRGLMLEDIGFVLGHAKSDVTERVYAHTKLYDVRRRMEALGDE